MIEYVFTAFKGFAMGIAEVIPGVSGGTIAFISGIYERLLNVIKSFHPRLFSVLRKEGIGGVWKAIDGNFLFSLVAGMAVGLVVAVFAITHLMATVPQLLWSFFLGLILASIVFIYREIPQWRWQEFASLLAGGAFAYWITVLSPIQGNFALWFVFLSGMIAICAFILPGISGSFMLLILGMYNFIIGNVKNILQTFAMDSMLIIAVFAAGCVTGITTFARVVSWAFKHYHSITLAAMTGFMIGTLHKIWPWRIPTAWLQDDAGQFILDSHGAKQMIMDRNVLPTDYQALSGADPMIIGAIVCLIVGFSSIFIIEKIGDNLKKKLG